LEKRVAVLESTLLSVREYMSKMDQDEESDSKEEKNEIEKAQ